MLLHAHQVVTDGPYAETNEILAGYWIVQCASFDRATKIAARLTFCPAALTHHLTVLKLANLVRVERRGQYQVYSLNTTVFQDLVSELLSWLSEPIPEQETSGPKTGDSP